MHQVRLLSTLPRLPRPVVALSFSVLSFSVLSGCGPVDGLPDSGPEPEPEPGFIEVSFSEGFVFGTAVAQWQVAGDQPATGTEPVESNWSRWMEMGKAVAEQQNPDGNGFVEQYEADLDRAAALGLTAFRISVDWSRIEPANGQWNDDELDHFVAVLQAAKDRGLDPVVTFWHWVVPTWVQNPKGDEPEGYIDLIASPDRAVVDEFEDFVRHVVPRIKGLCDTYTVLNEPFSMIGAGYLNGLFPPGGFLNIEGGTDFGLNLVFMQAAAYDAIKELDDEDADLDGQDSFVGFTQTANLFHAVDPANAQEQLAIESISYVFNDWPMIALTTGNLDINLDGDTTDLDTDPPEGYYAELEGRTDFVGVQYYGPVYVKDDTLGLLDNLHPIYGLPLVDVKEYAPERPHNGMGREISAKGFRDTIDHYAQWDVPILLTENGTTTNGRPVLTEDDELESLPRDEDQAAMYLLEHLWEVGRALEDGVDIRAYYHWTLADNYEWVEGRHQRFGAYTVDFEAAGKPRTLTKMGQALTDIVAARGIDEALWNTYVLERYPSDTREDGGLTTSEPVIRE